ncbi:MAG TPA: YihY/virulence factor BrkB family protein [Candidatus Eremiobacteraceae bacterium]
MDIETDKGRLRSVIRLFVDAAKTCQEHDVPRLSAALAYYAAFSLAPILVIAMAISGFVFGPAAARGEIFIELEGVLGVSGADAVQTMVISASRPAPGVIAAIVSTIVLAFGATAVFGELQASLNSIWQSGPRRRRGVARLFRERLLSLAMVAVIGFLLLVAFIVDAMLAGTEKYIAAVLPLAESVVSAGGIVITIAIVAALFAMIYRVVPDERLPWRAIWLGASVTAVLFVAGEAIIGIYLGHTAIASTYGAAGSLLVVLLWVYYSAQATLFGAATAKVLADRIHGTA